MSTNHSPTALLAHTPGPWKLEEFNSIVAHLPSGQDVQITCMAPTSFSGESVTEESEDFRKQTKANASLIAAAPELPASSKACVGIFEERLESLELEEHEQLGDEEFEDKRGSYIAMKKMVENAIAKASL